MIDVDKAVAILDHNLDTLTVEKFLENTGLWIAPASVERLPPQEKRVIDLSYRLGCTFREVSQIMGISEECVNQIHAEAVARMRADMARTAEVASSPGP